jgi:hypothetical protein
MVIVRLAATPGLLCIYCPPEDLRGIPTYVQAGPWAGLD